MEPVGRIALVGSGEYLPVMHGVEAWLLAGRPPRYVQLATAAAPEGASSLAKWHGLGAEAAQRLGVEQVIIDVRTREDAEDPRWLPLLEDAGVIYLSGGNPTFLADTLRDSLVWRAIRDQWLAGASLAGCSAGAMALADDIRHFRHPLRGRTAGLGVIPGVRVLPHFDRYSEWLRDVAALPDADAPTVIGIDEDTALIGEPTATGWAFTTAGRQSAWAVRGTKREELRAPVTLPVADR